ncbi:hypothetical protein COB72_02595 [bacterium]|nr:MAG: hypothetical protein COB72_02595 [bacterium]
MLKAYSIESQLCKEIGVGHPLYDVPFTVLATCDSCDDVLVELKKTGQRRQIHPTWEGLQEAPFPLSRMIGDPWYTLKIDGAIIRVDVDSTKAAYDKRDLSSYGGCDCGNCMNLAAQKELFPSNDIRRWLSALGINPSRPTDVTHYAPVKGGHLYSMTYHIRGRFDESSVSLDLYGYFTVSLEVDGEPITVKNSIGPPPEIGFELDPMLQISFMVVVPWVLGSSEPT